LTFRSKADASPNIADPHEQRFGLKLFKIIVNATAKWILRNAAAIRKPIAGAKSPSNQQPVVAAKVGSPRPAHRHRHPFAS
jgi:hypothetical protein